MLEVDAGSRYDASINLVAVAEQTPARDGRNLADRGGIRLVGHDAEQQLNGGERVCLGADHTRAQEVIDLLGRLATMASQAGTWLDVRAEQFAAAIVAELLPVAYGLGARLVAQQAQCKFRGASGHAGNGRRSGAWPRLSLGVKKTAISGENIPKKSCVLSRHGGLSPSKNGGMHGQRKKPSIPETAALVTTETDFSHSVDREIIRQVGGMNLRGLRILREALAASRVVLP